MKENGRVRSTKISRKDEKSLPPGAVFKKTSPVLMSQPSFMVHNTPLPTPRDFIRICMWRRYSE